MVEDIAFNRSPPAGHGVAEAVSPNLRRIVAPNASPFTFTGTCSYIVGHGRVAIVDPGPDDPTHVAAILDAVEGETIDMIVVTHTHLDHSPAARALAAATGATTFGAGPHGTGRLLRSDETLRLDASADLSFVPDRLVGDGNVLSGSAWTLEAIATPGHCANHLCFSLRPDNVLLSGDHVMAWSTSIVAPPDGSMGDYMASLQRLVGRPETTYFPGHGGPVSEPQSYLRALTGHRRMREAAILQRVAAGDDGIEAIVSHVYAGLAPGLVGAASLNTLAHLEDLVARGRVQSDGPPRLNGRYWVA
jgi:glyoxylase-like metal-dependent hydrolase (beta-lactamase superfamily II)